MAGLVPAIHVFIWLKDVDARHKAGHDASIQTQYDAIAFGRHFISNPDLPARIRHGVPFTPYNRATFYGGEATGYTDYPFHDELQRA
jgi:N-ethylmaleimide reductase